MHLFLQMSKLQETTSYFDENVGRVGVKSDPTFIGHINLFLGSVFCQIKE